MPDSSRLTKGYMIAVVGTVIWAASGVLIAYLTGPLFQMPPLVLAVWRDALVALSLVAVFAVIARPLLRVDSRHLPYLLVYGLALSLFNSLWTVSVALNGAGVATVLAYSSPAITALVSWRLLGERLKWPQVVAVILSLMGCVFVAGVYSPAMWRANPLGILTGLGAGAAFTVYSLMGKAASEKGINPWTTLWHIFAFAAVFLFIYNAILGWLPASPVKGGINSLLWLGPSLAGWAALLVLAWGPTIGGYGLYMVSLGYLPASVANLIISMEPMVTAFLAFIFLNERMTWPQYFGSALIITAVVLLRVEVREAGQASRPGEGGAHAAQIKPVD